jgi:hypothetical protein
MSPIQRPVGYCRLGKQSVFIMRTIRNRSRDSSVGIATSYGLDDRGIGVRVPVGSRILSSPDRPDRL